MEKQDLILLCSLGCTIYGIWISFCEIFGCQVNWVSFLIPAFVIAGAVSLLFLPWKWRGVLGILAVGTLVLVLYASRHMRRLLTEAEGLLYYVNQSYNEYYGTDFVGKCHECSMEHTLLWILLGIYCGVFVAIFAFRLRNLQYGFLPSYLVVAAGLLVGKTPGIRGVLFLLVGGVLAMFWFNGQEWGGRSYFHIMKVGRKGADWHRYPLFFLLLAAALVMAGRFARGTEKNLFAHGQKVQRVQMKLEKKVTQMATEISRYVQGNFSVDSNGKLNNDEPKYAERPVMEITMQEKPRAALYLKGFVGSHYQNGEWKREDVQTFEELFADAASKYEVDSMANDTLTQWIELGMQNYDEEDLASVLNWENTPRQQQMQIDYVGGGKWSSYTYLPYFVNLVDVYDVEEGGSLADMNQNFLTGDSSRPKTTSSYFFNYMGMTEYDLVSYYSSCAGLDSNEGPGVDCPIDFSDIEGNPMQTNSRKLQKFLKTFSDTYGSILGRYLVYAWGEYGYQEESAFFGRKDFMEELKKFNAGYKKNNMLRKMSTMDRVKFVQGMLEGMAEYSKSLDEVPEGEDYVEYFMLTQKKGFCEHFATAGTLLMRELGIPSRYVGGYKVPLNRFKKNEDGSYTAEVLDSDAHAWTEVLAGSLGWLPADMTPSSGSGTGTRNQALTAKKEAAPTPKPKKAKKPEPTATSTVKPTPTAEPTPTADAGQKKGQPGEKKSAVPEGSVLLGRVAAGIGGVFLIAALWVLCWRGYYGSRKRRLLHARGKSRNLYVRMRLHDMLSLMENCGVPVSAKMPEGQWLPAIEKLCGEFVSDGEDFGAGGREEFLRIVQKAAFSREEVSLEEYEVFRRQCGQLEDIAWRKAGKIRRRYLKLMGKYGNI